MNNTKLASILNNIEKTQKRLSDLIDESRETEQEKEPLDKADDGLLHAIEQIYDFWQLKTERQRKDRSRRRRKK